MGHSGMIRRKGGLLSVAVPLWLGSVADGPQRNDSPRGAATECRPLQFLPESNK